MKDILKEQRDAAFEERWNPVNVRARYEEAGREKADTEAAVALATYIYETSTPEEVERLEAAMERD